MFIEIKNKFSGIVVFKFELNAELQTKTYNIQLGAAVREANLYGVDLRGADLRGADLCGANLYGVDLRGADLCGANLYGVDLRGADLCGANLYGVDLRILQTDIWTVYIDKDNIRIGCQLHTANDWFKFNDKKINSMASNALEWWKTYKTAIKAIHKTIK